MKKFILIIAFALISTGAFAQVIFTEDFDYPLGDSVGAHGWVANTGGATNRIVVTSPGLTYSGYPGSGIGYATTLYSVGQDQYKELGTVDSTGSIYCSFMVRVDSAKFQGDYFLALLQAGSTSFYEGRVSVRQQGGNLNFGITKGNAGSDTTVAGIWSTGTYSIGTTYLVVLKYTFVPSGTTNDQVSLYVFDTGVPGVEPAVPTIGPITYTSLDATGGIGRIALRQGTVTRAPSVVVDGIRVMTSWFQTEYDIKMAIQGIYDSTTAMHKRNDTASVYLRNTVSPYAIVDSSFAILDSATLTGKFFFNNLPSGSYYIEAKYRKSPMFRNAIKTWSKAGGENVNGVLMNYDFTSAATQAYGSNMKLVGGKYVIWSGDATQDGNVSLPDITLIYNASNAFTGGYLSADLNYDGVVSLTDLVIAFNNTGLFVHAVVPPL